MAVPNAYTLRGTIPFSLHLENSIPAGPYITHVRANQTRRRNGTAPGGEPAALFPAIQRPFETHCGTVGRDNGMGAKDTSSRPLTDWRGTLRRLEYPASVEL